MGMSAKHGDYYGLNGNENRFLLGLGFGFLSAPNKGFRYNAANGQEETVKLCSPAG